MKIDIYAHILPEKYLATCRKKVRAGSELTHEAENRANVDLEVRFRLMDRYPDVVQVLTVSMPPLETIATPADAVDLARMANDELADLVNGYPDRFVGAAACLPLNDLDASLEEVDRAVGQLKLKGVQIFTNICGEPLDHRKFRPLFEKMAGYDLPLWIHPHIATGPVERLLGWPYETAAAMLRLVTAGIFQDYPDIKFITHHGGSMIPYFEQRLRWLFPLQEGARKLRNPLDHFRKFFNDTALYGSTPALTCAYDFFGADQLLFGTDMPLGPGYGLTMEAIQSIDRMDIPDSDKEKIFLKNAVELLRIAL